jgi:hypothetical protein
MIINKKQSKKKDTFLAFFFLFFVAFVKKIWLLHQNEQIQRASDGKSNLFNGFNCPGRTIILSNVKNITSTIW